MQSRLVARALFRDTESVLVGAVLTILSACSGSESAPQQGENVANRQEFVVWSPGQALLDEHNLWHRPRSCDQPGVRKCQKPGEDFLVFHRGFVHRLRAEFERQGLTHDITPWYELPAAMKNPANGWNATLQAAEDSILSLTDPATNQPFASLDAFGTFLETRYHDMLHSIARIAYNEPAVGPPNMSPSSTYFFKIHGLIEHHFQRFQRGDFNRDGKSDLVVRNVASGANRIWTMNGTTVVAKNAILTVDTGACGWYVGATSDYNMDGHLDLVWHGPGCAATHLWLMNGFTHTSTVVLPGVNSTWRLFGSGDFNADARPDLAWASATTSDVSIWVMNGTSYASAIHLGLSASSSARLVADVDQNGTSDILVKSGTTWEPIYSVQHMFPHGSKGPLIQVSTMGPGVYASAVATGRYHRFPKAADVAWSTLFGSNPPEYSFSLQEVSVRGTPVYAETSRTVMLKDERIQGPR